MLISAKGHRLNKTENLASF